MNETLQAAVAFFHMRGWKIHTTEDSNLVFTEYKGQHGSWQLLAVGHPERPQLALYAIFPYPCPKPCRPEAFELLHRANEGLILGNFEFLFQEDRIRFKTSLDFTGQQTNLHMCNPLTYYNCLSMDQYYTPILAVTTCNMDAEDAIRLMGKPPDAIPRNRRPG
jgi:hypothetical protein